MEKWEVAKISEIAKTTSGGTPSRKNPEFYTGDIPWIKSGDLNDGNVSEAAEFITEEALNSSSAKMFPAGTLMIALYGATIGKLGVLTIEAATNQAVCGIFVPEEVETKYLFYFLLHHRRELIKQGAGGAQPNISQKIIRDVEVPIAPLPEQRRIVARIEELFSRLDAGVAALRHAKAQLQRYRQSVLAAAVTGQLAQAWREQHPDTELAEELLERILEDRRETWNGRCTYKEPSPISEVPDLQLPSGWVWCSLDTVSEALGGFAFKSKDYTESGYQIVKMGNVRMHCLELGNKPSFIASVPDDIVEKYLLRPDDLIITLTGTRKKRDYGFVARVSNESDLLLNQRIARVRPCSHVASGFLLLALSAEYFRDQFFASETGNVGQGNVSMKAVTATAFALPPLAEQHQIVAEVESRTTVIDHLEVELDRQITRSNRLRQSTLAEAFLGTL